MTERFSPMQDTFHPLHSAYSEVRWSALNDAMIEGELPFAQLTLRHAKAQRQLCVRLTEVSAVETWSLSSETVAGGQEKKLSGRGELTEVLTTFELDGGPVQQFREVSEVTIQPAPVLADDGNRQDQDQCGVAGAGSFGVLFIEFEALKTNGGHPEPTLKLNITICAAEFQRIHALVRARSDEIAEITLVLAAELFGDEFELDESQREWPIEYGILRPSDAPLVFVRARLGRLDVVLEKSQILVSKPIAPATPLYDRGLCGDQPSEAFGIISRRLGVIIALLIIIVVVMLASFETGSGANIKRTYRQIAESEPPFGFDFV